MIDCIKLYAILNYQIHFDIGIVVDLRLCLTLCYKTGIRKLNGYQIKI
jgi:hypothetical protein